LKTLIESETYGSNFKVTELAIVPDEHPAVISTLSTWSTLTEAGIPLVQLCITTGGTGFSPRDRTPEAVNTLIVRHATGLQHMLLSMSLQKTPMAALARPVAGITAQGMLIVTVPGSPKGALENTEALLNIVPHALDLLSGGSGKAVHEAMGMPNRSQSESLPHDHSIDTRGHPHRHHHHHAGHSPEHQIPVPRSMDVSKGGMSTHFLALTGLR
jgi:gephyrin